MKKILLLLILLSLSSCAAIIIAQTLPYQDSTLSVEQRVNDLMGRMTLDEKIGQMMQMDLPGVQFNPTILDTYFVGSMLSGGGSDPITGNSAENWADMYDTVQTYALKTRLKIPLIYGVDAVHGHNNVVGATIFPHNIGLGCTGNPELVKNASRITAIEIAATGIDWTFAPCIAVPQDERWGRTYEGFGETTELAQIYGSAATIGLQGNSLSSPTSVLACAKHFLGDGGTTNGVDRGNTVADEATIRKLFLPGYITNIDSGVGSVMVSFSSINGVPMHSNKYWVTDVLKNELGFKGIVVSDYNGLNLLGFDYKTDVDLAVNAGLDMIMNPNTNFPTVLKELINEGKVSQERIDDAVKRILSAKFKLGLFERPFVNRSLLPLVGSDAHRAVARQCVRESMVLLKKKDGILPLKKKNVRILVAGTNANDLGNQCGGWTISWQGQNGTITTGTTIFQGMKKIAPEAQIEFSADGNFSNTTADYSVVVVGETPYAEAGGDRSDLGLTKEDVELVRKMKSFGAPVILIVVSGRPLILEKVLHFTDVIFAAWLPGTEGDGVAEVLFGNYQPKGKLSITWPKSMAQIPINFGDANYAPLYEYGYGITSTDDSPAGSSPVCLSSILTSDGKHFELTFNKQMSDPSNAEKLFTIYRYNIQVLTSAKVSLKTDDHTTLVIDMDTTYFRINDLITISYTGNIKSADGGTLQPMNQFEVNNNIQAVAVNVPAKIEAEDYSDMLGVQVSPTSDVDGSFELQGIDNGDWVEYLVNIPEDGNYYLTFRYSCESNGGQIITSCGGKTRTISLPVTGSWNTWKTTSSTKLTLAKGEQTLLLRALQGGFHLNWIGFSNSITSVEDNNLIPLVNKLEQNYPNPFNPETVIGYQLPATGHVKLKVYDMLGKEIAALVDKEQTAGNYQVKFNAGRFPSGIYFYKLQAGSFTEVKKMMILK